MVITISSQSTPEEIKKALQKVEKGLKTRKRVNKDFNAFKYCGVIDLKKDPVAIQKSMRDEWQQQLPY